jgi:hypothetical protein
MKAARAYHHSILLPGGKVLVFGGADQTTDLLSAELYDPASDSFIATWDTPTTTKYAAVAMLATGSILIAGGVTASGAPIGTGVEYVTGEAAYAVTGTMGTARYHHSATLLNDGSVLVVGGLQSSAVAGSERYVP